MRSASLGARIDLRTLNGLFFFSFVDLQETVPLFRISLHDGPILIKNKDMKLVAMLVLVLVSLSGSAWAEGEKASSRRWSKLDVGLQLTVGALFVGDYLQTRQIIRDANDPSMNVYENNPIMGRRGERMSPELYFPLVMTAHTVIAHYLPKPYRSIWQGVTVGFQVKVVSNNYSFGYKFNW